MIAQNKTILFSTPRFDLCRDQVIEKTKTTEYYYISKQDAVLIVPYDASEKKMLFIESNRYVIGNTNIEIPGGRVEKGEDPLIAAKRELYEECSLESEAIEFGLKIHPLPSLTNENVYIFFSKHLNLETATLTDSSAEENIKSLRILTFEQASDVALNGTMKCAVDAFAVLLFLSKIKTTGKTL